MFYNGFFRHIFSDTKTHLSRISDTGTHL